MKTARKTDISETSDDKKHLQPEETTLDLPEVKDIPGQEHVRPLPAGEMADTTISSADEEADELLDTNEDITANGSNVSKEEKELLRKSSESTPSAEEDDIKGALVDDTDEDGEPLNEKVNRTGSDLDVPGSEDDDADEEIGEEDEENNSFSLPD